MPRSVRSMAMIGFIAVIVFGLWASEQTNDGQWLALLFSAWLLLLLAVWPALPESLPASSRTVLRTAAIIASAFAILTVQLVRIQVITSATTVQRVGVDPATDEIIANPRIQLGDLEIDRGSVFDRHGALLAGTVFRNGVATRIYPDPESGYVVGYFSPLLYGKNGLEETFNAELSGHDGSNAITRGIDALLGRPQTGLNLHLTLDAELQRSAHALLGDRTGAVVILDVTTGGVLTLASSPNYDPNRLFTSDPSSRSSAVSYWTFLIGDPNRPLVLRATSGQLTPGSTFKVVTAAAIIDAGFASPDSVYEDTGQLDVEGHIINEYNRPDENKTMWTLREGIAWSLNVVFAQIGLELGPGLMRDYADRFGFGHAPPFDLPIAESQLASSSSFVDSLPGLADTAFGQGQILATPMEMALVTAAIANSGSMPQPYLVDSIQTRTGETVQQTQPQEWRHPVSASTANQTRDLMIAAVAEGVAQAATVDGYVVGAKTGTAETGDGSEPHAWFIGFIGQPEPEYAVAVVLEHGGAGLDTALAVGRDMLINAMNATP